MAAVVGDVVVGTVHIECPACGAEVPIEVTASIQSPELSHLGGATLVYTPDMADITAHMWRHEES